MDRRNFINASAIGAGGAMLTGVNIVSAATHQTLWENKVLPIAARGNVSPISPEEFKSRVHKAQRLMEEQGIRALLLDSGTSMRYFTGVSWGASERPMIAGIPAKGDIWYVCPGFEEARLQEIVLIGNKIYTWQEDESPYAQAAIALKESGITSGKIGIEERMRFFICNGIQKEAGHLEYVSGDPVTIPCRMIKSGQEIALMQNASEITLTAMLTGLQSLKEGSTPDDFARVVEQAHKELGGQHEFAGCNFAEASAFPHGSIKPQLLKKGDIVLIDCGCSVEGYYSDISRTIVFGAEPTRRQRDIWNLEKRAQAAGFDAAGVGMPLQNVDAAARKVLTDAGFGPGYKLPGLPHRTGHGIGMDVHEWGNAVKGNPRLLEPGMCFSIEPNISIVGEFGVRLEDCVHMTAEGPQWFSLPSPSIEEPFA